MCHSGVYDVCVVGWGERSDAVYFNNPMDYVTHLRRHLDWLRGQVNLLLLVGRGQWEDTTGALEAPSGSRRSWREGDPPRARRLGPRVAARLADWRAQLAHHLPRFCRASRGDPPAARAGRARPLRARSSSRRSGGASRAGARGRRASRHTRGRHAGSPARTGRAAGRRARARPSRARPRRSAASAPPHSSCVSSKMSRLRPSVLPREQDEQRAAVGSRPGLASAASRIVGARSTFATRRVSHAPARHAGPAHHERHADRRLVDEHLPRRHAVLAVEEAVVGGEDDQRVVELAGLRAASRRSTRRPRRPPSATRAAAGSSLAPLRSARASISGRLRITCGLSDTSASLK